MARRSKVVRLDIRLYPGRDDDLIAWVQDLAHEPYGGKMQRVRAALRQGLVGSGGPTPPSLDLAEIRQVVEAAVSTALARFEGSIVTAGQQPVEENDEAEALLNDLGTALQLQE